MAEFLFLTSITVLAQSPAIQVATSAYFYASETGGVVHAGRAGGWPDRSVRDLHPRVDQPGQRHRRRSAGYEVPSTVEALVPQPDGRILVGGTFTRVAGAWREQVARLNPDGSLDLTFPPTEITVASNSAAVVWALVRQPDGHILVNGLDRPLVARLKGDALPLRFGSPRVTPLGVTLPIENVWPWQRVGLVGSSNLVDWQWLATNRPASNSATFFEAAPPGPARKFYRALQMGP